MCFGVFRYFHEPVHEGTGTTAASPVLKYVAIYRHPPIAVLWYKLMLFEFALQNTPNLHIITSFAYQGKLQNEIYSVPWEDDGILPNMSSPTLSIRESDKGYIRHARAWRLSPQTDRYRQATKRKLLLLPVYWYALNLRIITSRVREGKW